MDVTETVTASTTTDSAEPLPANTPRLAGIVKLVRVGNDVQLSIDGQPFPWLVVEGVEFVMDLHGGPSYVRLTLVCERLDIDDQPAPEPEPVARVDVPPGITQLIKGIAKNFPAVTYHQDDRNRLAIEQAARDEGIQVIPSATIQPRSIQGVELPGGRRG